MRTVVLRVAALALLLLLALVAVITVRTLHRLPNVVVYFIASDATSFRLEPAYRRGTSRGAVAVARETVAALAQGPTPQERARGLASAVPAGTRVLGARLDGTTLTVNLSSDFERGGGSASMVGRLDQLFYTLTRPSNVHSVSLQIDGTPVTAFAGEGVVVPQPWRRSAHPDHPVW